MARDREGRLVEIFLENDAAAARPQVFYRNVVGNVVDGRLYVISGIRVHREAIEQLHNVSRIIWAITT